MLIPPKTVVFFFSFMVNMVPESFYCVLKSTRIEKLLIQLFEETEHWNGI